MKKLLLAVVLCTSLGAFSQIEVLEKTKKIESRISYAYIEKDADKQYDFYFKNMNFVGHEYVKFSFRANGKDYDALYNVISKGFKESNGVEPIKIKANGELVILKYVDENGTRFLQFQKFIDNNNPESIAASKLFTPADMKALFKK